MKTVLLNNVGYQNADWQQALQALLPEMQVLTPAQSPDPASVEYAAIWEHPVEDLFRYPHLRGVLVLGAGCEHFAQAERVPSVPIVRLHDPEVARDMALHALHWVIHFQRGYDVYADQQKRGHWERHAYPAVSGMRILVLGLGAIGQQVALMLEGLGYAATGWSAGRQTPARLTVLSGLDTLPLALQSADILINCLPLTDATCGLLNYERLQQLPHGACLINISRGAILDELGLLTVLEQGRVRAAALDAFAQEPLPSGHPFWKHPRIHITPHCAGMTYVRSAARVVAASIRQLERGEVVAPLFEFERGY